MCGCLGPASTGNVGSHPAYERIVVHIAGRHLQGENYRIRIRLFIAYPVGRASQCVVQQSGIAQSTRTAMLG